MRNGEVLWPPPPVQVSAAPAAAATAPKPAPTPAKQPMPAGRRSALVGLAAALLFVATAFAPNQLVGNLTVFALSVVIGYYVIGKVHHALHTPLMSVTNAISGIIVVGAILQLGHISGVVTVLAFIAVLLASINVFGGLRRDPAGCWACSPAVPPAPPPRPRERTDEPRVPPPRPPTSSPACCSSCPWPG